MKATQKKLDFTGTKLFIGIDVHLRQWTVTIRTFNVVLRTFSMNPNPQQLFNYLTQHYPNASYYSVYEAGFSGFWAHRKLLGLGIKNIIVNAADVPTTHKQKTQKQDKRDSRKLANELMANNLQANYVPSAAKEALRLLSRRIVQISKSSRQTKTRIKHFLHTQGIDIPKNSVISHWSARFIRWLRSLEFEQQHSHFYLNGLLDELEIIRHRKLNHLRKSRAAMKGNKIILYLRTVPGVAFTTAFAFYTEIIDISRFQKLDHLTAFIGIIPSIRSSDEKEDVLGITNRYCKHLRNLLIEAAWVAVRKDPALTMAFENLLKDHCKQKAIIRITKKLVNRMRYVWIKQQEYVMGVVQ
jgi:transposase